MKIANMNKTLSDSTTFVVADDANVLCFVNLNETNVVTLPTSKTTSNFSWRENVHKEIGDLIGSNVPLNVSLHKITKIWLPDKSLEVPYIINIVVWINVNAGFKNFFTIPTSGRFATLKWLNTRDLYRFYNLQVVSSPVLLDIFPKLKTELKNEYSCSIPLSIQVAGRYQELTADVFNRGTGNNFIDQMIEDSPLKTSRIEIYKEYLRTIFPDILMSCGNFQNIASRLGFNRQDVNNLFRAADLTNRGFLSFNEYFGICAALEPSTKHSGIGGKARATYIFRFLNKTNDGKLSLKDLKQLVIMARQGRQLSVDAASIENELKETAAQLSITATRMSTIVDFIKVAEDPRFRGVNNILRSSQSLTTSLQSSTTQMRNATKSIDKLASKPLFMSKSIQHSLGDSVKWSIATHILKIGSGGSDLKMQSIFDSADICPKIELDNANITLASRSKSIECFAQSNICNDIIGNVRMLAKINNIRSGNRGPKMKDYSWGQLNVTTFAQKLMTVSRMASDIFLNEPRMLILQSPIYILGDFHGNFGDLLSFEHVIWPLSFSYVPSAVLFLGDYVDRGWYSIELIAYLLANKILYRDKIFMLRGNHEIRDVQLSFTFLKECTAKFGDLQGKAVWEAVNCCFDTMPVAAVVDQQLFCVHGGIPPPWLCPNIETINKIPKPLPQPDTRSPLAWEILWNDPIKNDEINKEIFIEMSSNSGFAANKKRGTAHIFNNAATETFLNKHNFTHLIRAHELSQDGFNIFHKGAVISIFSTSKYNGGNNESACLLIENLSIKVIRMNPNI